MLDALLRTIRFLSLFALIVQSVFVIGLSGVGVFISTLFIFNSPSIGGINFVVGIIGSITLLYCLISVFFSLISIISNNAKYGTNIKTVWWVGIWLGFGLSLFSIITNQLEIVGDQPTIFMFFSMGALFYVTFAHALIEYYLQRREYANKQSTEVMGIEARR